MLRALIDYLGPGPFVAALGIIVPAIVAAIAYTLTKIRQIDAAAAYRGELLALKQDALVRGMSIEEIERIALDQNDDVQRLKQRGKALELHARELRSKLQQYERINDLRSAIARLTTQKGELDKEIADLKVTKARVKSGAITLDGYSRAVRAFSRQCCDCSFNAKQMVGQIHHEPNEAGDTTSTVAMCLVCRDSLWEWGNEEALVNPADVEWYYKADRNRWARNVQFEIRKRIKENGKSKVLANA